MQGLEAAEPTTTKTLGADGAMFYLSVINPRAMVRRVVDHQAPPYRPTGTRTEVVDQRLLAMRVEVVHHQVDGMRTRIGGHRGVDPPREGAARAIARRTREVPSALRFHDAKQVGRPAALVFIVPFGDVARAGGPTGTYLCMQRDGFLVQTDHWCLGVVRLLV